MDANSNRLHSMVFDENCPLRRGSTYPGRFVGAVRNTSVNTHDQRREGHPTVDHMAQARRYAACERTVEARKGSGAYVGTPEVDSNACSIVGLTRRA